MAGDLDPIDFRALTPASIAGACGEAIARCDAAIGDILAVPDGARTFGNTMYALESAFDGIEQAAGSYAFMAQVADDDSLRAEARQWDQALDRYMVDLRFREDIYEAIRGFSSGANGGNLDPEERRLLDHWLRDYRRHGFELPREQREHLRTLFERLVMLGVEFRNELADWDDGISVRREELAGLPESYVGALRTETVKGVTRYRVSLDYPELHPFMANAERADLRRELYRKDQCKGGTANVRRLEEALAIRREIATLLGYESWADYVTETLMAKSRERVDAFLGELRARLEPKATADQRRLAERKLRQYPGAALNAWDWRYYHSEELRERYGIDDFAVAEYFPLDACIEGLFAVTQSLLGVRFVEVPGAPAWNSEVRAFDTYDQGGSEPIARFYMDLFPRPNTYGHAAAFSLRRGRALADGSYQRPISAIVANFTRPVDGRPSLLRHQEVVTLFHEFGHILHQCLTRSRFLRFSGTETERDFVEAPSQMLEHWCWDASMLRSFSRHYRSGEPLAEATIAAMVAARTLNSGVFYTRQLFFATLDMALHSPGFGGDSTATVKALHGITGFDYLEGTHFQSGFGHLFGYDAGYYGYLWSQVFGDDMFTRFASAGLLNPAVGREYRRQILEPGGSRDGGEMVRAFLGREATQDAFLRGIGLDGDD